VSEIEIARPRGEVAAFASDVGNATRTDRARVLTVDTTT
jgi:hypothetical protein